MRKLDAFAVSLLLGGAAVAGAVATLETVGLGASVAATTTVRVADATIAARRAKLDRWSASLARARAAKPPPLPKLPHYAPVVIPTVPPVQQVAAAPPPVQHVVEQRTVVVPASSPQPAVVAPQPQPAQVAQAAPAYREGDDSGEHEHGGGGWDDGGGDD